MLSEETLIKKFTSLSSQKQFSFVHCLQKPEHLLKVLNFPLKVELFQISVQLILSMVVQIMGLNHDQGIPESFLGFLLSLSESTLFNYHNFITDSIHEKLPDFSSLRAFRYQSYLMYLILHKFSVYFESLLDPQDPIRYGIVSIIQKNSFVRNQPSGLF